MRGDPFTRPLHTFIACNLGTMPNLLKPNAAAFRIQEVLVSILDPREGFHYPHFFVVLLRKLS
jgi:hypothetical protein